MKYKFLELSEIDSTNDYIKRKKVDSTEYIVLAERQTAGKGRLGRSFLSDEGGLYLSISYTPGIDIKPEQTTHYTALCALAVKRALEKTSDISCNIKWPNDIYISGKKVCGILTEAVHRDGRFYIIFGIGVNLTNDISNHISYAASIYEITGKIIDKTELSQSIAAELIFLLSDNQSDFSSCLEEYTDACITIGKDVKTATVTGKVVGVDKNAHLMVQTTTGETEKVFFGEAIEF